MRTRPQRTEQREQRSLLTLPSRDGICVVTKEQGGKDMDKKHGKIDKWLTEIGF